MYKQILVKNNSRCYGFYSGNTINKPVEVLEANLMQRFFLCLYYDRTNKKQCIN